MPSRRHQLQQLVATRRRQQQLPQTNVENGKLLSILRRSKAGGHGQGPIRPARSGGTESSHHGKGWLPLTPSAGMEVMVALVDGRRRRRPVYVRYFLYYSCRRRTRYLFFWWLAVEKTGSRVEMTALVFSHERLGRQTYWTLSM